MQQQLSMPTLCELTFAVSSEDRAQEVPIWPGASVRLDLQGELLPLFSGQVTAVEYRPRPSTGHEVRVRAYDALHALRKRQPIRAHVQVTLESLARELVADSRADGRGKRAGSGVAAPDPARAVGSRSARRCGGPVRRLPERARYDAASPHARGHRHSFPLRIGETLLEARIEVNTRPGMPVGERDGLGSVARRDVSGHGGSCRAGRTGLSEAAPDRLGAPGHRTLADEIATAEDQVTAAAQAELDTRVAREIVLRGLASGDVRLAPGARVQLSGLPRRSRANTSSPEPVTR